MPRDKRKHPEQAIVFGPVPSRRLGLSLGVDLVPHKTCTYDCLYCEVGRTTCKATERAPFVSAGAVIEAVTARLRTCVPDTITLAGSGEPTLNLGLAEIIEGIRRRTAIPIAVLTNGSLLHLPEVCAAVRDADKVLPTLAAGREETLQRIHRPHPGLSLETLLRGLEDLRRSCKGTLLLEVFLLAGLNDSPEELAILQRQVAEIAPDAVHLNTVVRPPADSEARPLSPEALVALCAGFGPRAEVIAAPPRRAPPPRAEEHGETLLLEMLKRRPLRPGDVAEALGISSQEAERVTRRLLNRDRIREERFEGEVFFRPAPPPAL